MKPCSPPPTRHAHAAVDLVILQASREVGEDDTIQTCGAVCGAWVSRKRGGLKIVYVSDWVDLLSNNIFLKKLYGSSPSLEAVEVQEIVLSPHGPELTIRFNLFEIPRSVPQRWGTVNRIQIELSFMELKELSITRIEPMNISSISFRPVAEGLHMEISGDTVLKLTSPHAWIRKVSGYWLTFDV